MFNVAPSSGGYLRGTNRARVCKHCKFSSTDAKEFFHHQFIAHHQTIDTFKCDLCDYTTADFLDLEKHCEIHQDNTQRHIKMSSEAEIATTMDDDNNNEKLKRQLSGSSTGSTHKSPLTSPVKTYTCDECGTPLENKKAHLHHMVDEHGYDFEVHECDMCEYATQDKHSLDLHFKKHFLDNSSRGESSRNGSPVNTDTADKVMQPPVVTSEPPKQRYIEITPRSVLPDLPPPSSVFTQSLLSPNFLSSRLGNVGKDIAPVSSAPAKPKPTPPVRRCTPVREAVDPAKYMTIQENDGVKYSCSKCGNIYKWRKSLNKHWKEKHDGEVPEPRSNMTPLAVPRLQRGSYPYNQVSPRIQGSSLHQQQKTSPGGPFARVSPSQGAFKSPSMRVAEASMRSPNMFPSPNGFMTSPTHFNHSPFNGMYPRPGLNFSPSGKQAAEAYFVPGIRPPMPKSHTPEKETKYNPSLPPAAHTQKPIAPLRQLEALQPESAMNLSKSSISDIQGQMALLYKPMMSPKDPSLYDAPIDIEADVLDLSKSGSGKRHSPQKHNLPVQDEPLDFSATAKSKPSSHQLPYASYNMGQDKTAYTNGMLPPPPVKSRSELYANNAKLMHCSMCTFVTRGPQELEEHLQLHNTAGQYRCAVCKEGFSTMPYLNSHFQKSHMELIPEMSHALVNGDPESSTQLYKYLTSNKSMSCAVCGVLFTSQWSLCKHFDAMHTNLPNPYKKREIESPELDSAAKRNKSASPENGNNNNASYKCNQCSFSTGVSSELARHQIKHSLYKQSKCSYCNFKTQWKDEMIKHYKQDHPAASTMQIEMVELEMAVANREQTPSPKLDTSPSQLSDEEKGMIDMDGENIPIVIPQAPEDSNSKPSPSKGRGNKRVSVSEENAAEALLPYRCNICEYRARWPSEITQHMKNHSDDKPYHCPRCAYKSKWKWDVVKHLKRCGGGTVKDVIDTTKLKNGSAIASDNSISKTRELSNGPPNVTVMPNYNENAASPYNDMSEMSDSSDTAGLDLSGSNMSQFYCRSCPFVANSNAELKRHSRVHSDEKPYICKTCGYCSKWKCDLKKHLKTYNHTSAVPLTYGGHGRKPTSGTKLEDVSSGAEEDTDGVLSCELCLFTTRQQSLLDNHMKIHSPSKSSASILGGKHICKQCGFEADDLPAFLQHKKTHSNGDSNSDNNDDVDLLHDTSNIEGDLLNTSDGGGNKRKRKQPKQFVTKAVDLQENSASGDEFSGVDLDDVMKNAEHTDDEIVSPSSDCKHTCSYCPYKTNVKSNFERHVAHHTINKRFKCEWCNWSTDRLNALGRHAQIVHPNQFRSSQGTFYKRARENSTSESPENVADSSIGDHDEGGEMFPEAGTVTPPTGTRKAVKRRLKHCSKCDYITENITTLQRHMAKHGKAGKYTCRFCDYSVDREHILEYHVDMVHSGNRQRMMPVGREEPVDNDTEDDEQGETDMSIGYKTEDQVEVATVRGHEIKLIQRKDKVYNGCLKCPYTTDNISNLMTHLKHHGANKLYTCDYCDYSLNQLHRMINHMKTLHSDKVSMKETPMVEEGVDRESAYVQDFMDKNDSSDHSDGVFTGKAFMSNNDERFKKSMSFLKTNKPSAQFACRKCSYVTNKHSNMVKHRHMHLMQQQLQKHKCAECGYTTTTAHLLRIHLKTHGINKTIIKAHQCDRCPYRTEKKTQLIAHKTRHGFNGKCNCPYCDYSCGNTTQLGNHVKLHFPGRDLDRGAIHSLMNKKEGEVPMVEDSGSATDMTDADDRE